MFLKRRGGVVPRRFHFIANSLIGSYFSESRTGIPVCFFIREFGLLGTPAGEKESSVQSGGVHIWASPPIVFCGLCTTCHPYFMTRSPCTGTDMGDSAFPCGVLIEPGYAASGLPCPWRIPIPDSRSCCLDFGRQSIHTHQAFSGPPIKTVSPFWTLSGSAYGPVRAMSPPQAFLRLPFLKGLRYVATVPSLQVAEAERPTLVKQMSMTQRDLLFFSFPCETCSVNLNGRPFPMQLNSDTVML